MSTSSVSRALTNSQKTLVRDLSVVATTGIDSAVAFMPALRTSGGASSVGPPIPQAKHLGPRQQSALWPNIAVPTAPVLFPSQNSMHLPPHALSRYQPLYSSRLSLRQRGPAPGSIPSKTQYPL